MNFFKSLSVFFLFINSVFSQGLPPISVYTAKDYHAENQNWSITQSQSKEVYVANNQGLLEFDGASWRLYPMENETIVRSVKAVKDKIYTGFYNGFGYWEKNDFGVLKFTSLSSEIDLLEDEQFWHIEILEGWVLFQSLERIYLYNLKTKEYKIIQARDQILSMFKAKGTIYYQVYDEGIYLLRNGISQLISSHKIFKKNKIVGIHELENRLVFTSESQGLFYLENGVLLPWNESLNSNLRDYTLYSSLKSANGNLILGTISEGVIVLNNEGNIKYYINQKKGLNDNTVLSVFEDQEENIWLGLDDGINIIDINSPFKVHRDYNGILGTIYASILHEGKIYLGTNQGLFCKTYKKEEEFKFVENTEGQVWGLKIIEGELLCGHNSGTFLIKDTKAELIGDVMGTWKIESLGKNRFLQGNYSGLYVFAKEKGSWRLKNKIEGFNISSRYFEIGDDASVFVNHEYKGVYKIDVDEEFTKVENVSILNSVEKGIHSALLKYKNNILYSYKKGVYRYNFSKNIFEKDTVLSKYALQSEYISGVLVNTSAENKLWGFSKKNVSYIEQGTLSKEPIIHHISIPLKDRKGATGFENICELSQNRYLLGTSNGYITLNLRNIEKHKDYKVKINQIKNSSLTSWPKNVNLTTTELFHNNQNNFKFTCSVPVFNEFSQVEYQYQLEGLNSQWSSWREESDVFFENLPFGKYHFRVRAKINGILTTNVASYQFKIDKPWYISIPMIVFYFGVLALFSVFMHIMYNRYYAKQRERILSKKQREFELHKLENEQKMTLLENEKLEADVTLKNKELASSTMSVIKKNELLNSIKEELLKTDGQKNIDNVIKIIDKSLNNSDDWKLFEEAFNNADKDFIKKIKTEHPSLTNNDLRLCAYLRLNLSSKEIAPLLNISTKSVEVKRYRLRKKMNLTNEENLVDHILEM
ncbi:triple tyrosine motif-containing protein [Wenyingzhuangia sp. 2_MG-2023]|uniref:triple tyrosine motif-containing protein n=1 Tax=Wenyingzhuangia sp. 2_MG-2023 TaxID=3062639 RepID=UPI0026E1FD7C|nr:triple tyrosine motif-containing protein [Wenyingzhuangia sp. 2_MG-2023]MDO6737281.1 triple tyrosine motif-containing protein [Wenyingzhuangia sp. 2_MG-2023]